MNWTNFTEVIEVSAGLGLHGWPDSIPMQNTAYMSKFDVDELLLGFEGTNPSIYFYPLSDKQIAEKRAELMKFRKGDVSPGAQFV